MVATWIGDTAAFLVGRRLGGIKLAPRISPNKTIAGAVSGLVGSALVGAIGFQTFGMGSAWLGIASGALIGTAGQLGDLAESFLKRQAGVKDSGNVIPGHGGVLDRIDALLFAFPAGWLIATLIDGLAR
jgi:phosphatidate cytidylyltransferase